MKKFLIATILCLITMPAFAASVTLQWDPNDPAAEGYRIYERIEGESYDYANPKYDGANTSCTFTDLVEGTTYYYVARAYEGDVESGDSNEVEYTASPTTSTVYVYPGAPQLLAYDGAGVTWSAPAGATPESYNVYLDGAIAATVVPTSYSTLELEPGTTHTVQVEAVLAGMVGPKSDIVEFTTPVPVQTIRYPAQPGELRLIFNSQPETVPDEN